MKPLNTIQIEVFFEKVRAARNTNQKAVTMDIKDATMLADTLAVMLTRLVAGFANVPEVAPPSSIKINADGGSF